MNVRIYLDLDKLHLVAQGLRHRAELPRVPDPGERVSMLCGLVDEVEYTNVPEALPVHTCWPCDLKYRQKLGLAIPPTHPGFNKALLPPSPRKRPYAG